MTNTSRPPHRKNERGSPITLYIREGTRARLEALATSYGSSMSEVVRYLIEQAPHRPGLPPAGNPKEKRP